MRKKEDIVSFDVQGWPIYRMNVREILKSLGCELKDGKWEISDEDPRLNIYPRRLISDCMGYGLEEQNIVEISMHLADERINEDFCSIFTEPTMKNIELWKKGKFHEGAFVTVNGKDTSVWKIKEENGELYYLCKNELNEKGEWFKESEIEW